jgi:tetratricopeptide (TPR) repeat protein
MKSSERRQQTRISTVESTPSPVPRRALVAAGVMGFVLVFVLIAHWPGLHANALCFDDGEYLTNNPLVRNPSPGSAWRFLREVLEPSTVHGYYQPLTMISLMVDYALGGRPDHLLAFHRTSLLLHLANTLLIMLLLYRLFGNALAAGVAGLLFGVHPMTVETIVWVGERKTVLATFFVLLSVLSYVRFVRSGEGHRRWITYASSVVLFGLALLAKPTVTPLPACLILLDYWPLRRLTVRTLLEKVPFFVVAAASALITVESQRRTAVAVMPGESGGFFVPYIICHDIVFYLRKMVWPAHMSSHYSFPVPFSMANKAVATGVIGTFLLIVALATSWRWTRALVAGWAFFFVAIFPTLGVIGFTNVIAADKYAYWPALGILLILAWLVSTIAERTRDTRPAWSTLAPAAAAIVAAAALTIATRGYLRQWATTESLSRYMVSLDDKAAAPLIHLAQELLDQGRSAEAIPYFARATIAAPAYEGTFYGLGNALRSTGRLDEAIAAYRRAIELKPDYSKAYTNLGNALLDKGDVAGAIAAYRKALEATPRSADIHYNLANALLRANDATGAIEHFQQALTSDPSHAAAHKNLAGVLLQQGDVKQAVGHYEEALRLQPKYWDAAALLANLYSGASDPAMHQPARAIELARHAVTVTGGRNIPALAALANALGRAGQTEQAAEAARQALEQARAGADPRLMDEVQRGLAPWLAAGASQNGPSR